MLTQLHIQNFALIEDLHVELSRGFNVLTGETGAGKSIIIDALNAVLGERMPSEAVRSGAEKSLVEGSFDLSANPRVMAKAEELGVEPEDGLVLISREISRSGKSQCRVNGRLATAAMIKELTRDLVDMHGQHEHQSLLAIERHLDIFDAWCGEGVHSLRAQVAEASGELRALRRELERIQSNARERARMLDLYHFQANEIQAAKLQPGEEEELLAERVRLSSVAKLQEMSSAALAALAGGAREEGAVDALACAARQLETMAEMDPSIASALEALETALYASQEAQAAVRDYRDQIEADPSRLESVEERLDVIRSLKKKYGDSVDEVIAYGDDLDGKIEELTRGEEIASDLLVRIEAKEEELQRLAAELSRMRKSAAGEFAAAVVRELNDLAMERTLFEVGMEPCEVGPSGADRLEFLISPNPGEPLKPLMKIASGGEMSRIMLALKTVMAGADRVPTLVFDEIDTGIGGRTATVVGEKLSTMAARSQVMCVTHLPQIASKAGTHFCVEKAVEGNRTRVRVKPLKGQERIDELARMLGGNQTEAAVHHAREMLGRS